MTGSNNRKPAPTSVNADLFVSTTVHERPVPLGDGTERTLYFREVSAVQFRQFQLAERSDDADVRAGSIASLIAASLCEPDGRAAITEHRAAQLKPGVAAGILQAVLDVNGMLGKQTAGNAGNGLPPGERIGSGTSSPSHSAGEPSTSGSA